MATSINTNLASLFAQNSLSNAQNNLASSVQRLSSGLRINSAKDDAAGLSIAQNMQSQINGTNQSIRNLSDATNLLQVADSSLSTVQDMLLRLKQLSVQGFDGSLSASQKLNIVQEMKDLNSEINATAQRTQFNGINLLTSGASLDTVNSDVKNGVTLINSAAQVSTTSGLGAGSTLNDAGNTIYSLSLTDSKAQYAPGTYTLQASGNNLTMTGTFQGKVQSQTVALADLVGYAPSTSGLNRPVITNINFSNFGIEMRLTSSIAAGTTETGATLAAAITTKSNSIVVDGKGGQISNVKLSGVNPGTYQMTFGNTGSVSSFGMPAGLVSGQTAAGTAQSVALVGGNGSGATANISYDAQGKISSIAVQSAGTGYKAGDVLSTAAITAGTVNAATITTAQGASASTESASVTFAALNAGQTVTLGGLTFTAGSTGANATQVANAFANLQNGATTGLGIQITNGTGSYSGTFNGWSTGAANGSAVQFTSTLTNTDVTNLAAGPGSASVVINTTQGASVATEATRVVFKALNANESFTLGGNTFTAGSADLTADQVAYAFTGLLGSEVDTTALNAVKGLAGVTGTFTATAGANGWSTSSASRTRTNVNDDTLVFTKTTSGATADLAVGGIPTIATTAGGTGAVTENAKFTFTQLDAGKSINIGGLMFTAGTAAVSAVNVAAAFANLANGATTGAGTSYGSYSGQLTGYSTSAPGGSGLTDVTYTSTTAGVNLANNLAIVESGSSLAAIVTNTAGTASTTEIQTVTFNSVLAAGKTATISGLTITAGATDLSTTQLAAAFANLASGVTGDQLNANGQGGGVGVFSGTFTGWNTGAVTPGGSSLVFTSAIPNVDRAAIALTAFQTGIGAPTIVEGSPGVTESASVTFEALAKNQSITMGGLTFKATSNFGASAKDVAAAFANLSVGDTPATKVGSAEVATVTISGPAAVGNIITIGNSIYTAGTTDSATSIGNYFVANPPTGYTVANIAGALTITATAPGNVVDLTAVKSGAAGGASVNAISVTQGSVAGTYSGVFSGWNTGAAVNTDVLTFTSTTGATDVNNLSASLPQNPALTVVTSGVTGATETARATFRALAAGEITTLNGRTFTAGASGASAGDVATAFTLGGAVANGVMTGTNVNANWTPAGAVTNTNQVLFTAAGNGDYTDLASPVAGQAPVIVTTQQGGATNSTETAQVTFDAAAMTSGDTVTVGGLTFTAGANGATRAQVAAAFSNLPAGTSSANLSSVNGTFSGTLTGWSTGASNGTGVSFTSATASTNVDNLTSSVSRRQALNALSGIVVGGLANQTGGNVLTMSGLINGNLQTQGITLKDNAANTSQTLNFDKFGVQFDVDSFQAQTGGEIGAVLASLNSSSANYGTTGAFAPGQVVVSQGANSALKFQSGADSSSFIQIDTLNIQTGSSGIEAGSDKQMMDVGSVIADSGVGKLGALGLNDSIDTWQTAFKNAAAAVDTAIEYVSAKRATYGSQMNRLSFITTNLTAQSTNLQNSRSAIIDTDFASETAKLTKGQIMQQAATAMLAQANQMPNVILSLLK